MHLLSVQNLSKHYADKTLFDNVSFHISPGDRIGIVGVNGSGKTTLLKMLIGLESPDSGQISRNPKARLEYLPQNPKMDEHISVLDYLFQGNSPTMQLLRAYESAALALDHNPANTQYQKALTDLNHRMDAENGWAAEANVKAVSTRLGISNFNSLLGELSGGQRRRAALARALIDPANLLILDEPTNHIDPETIAWLETYLSNLKAAILMVTHDRYFLDRVVNKIMEIDRGEIHLHQGNYSLYLENAARRQATEQKQTLNRRRYLQRELAWLHRSPMARGGKQKARIQRAETALENAPSGQNAGLNISVASRRTGKQILELKHISKRFDDAPVIGNFSYVVNKGARVGIIGPNGVGKSTLLNIIAGRLPPDAGELKLGATIHLGYYDQEGEALNENQRVLDNIVEIADVIQIAGGAQVSAAQMLERFQFSRKAQRSYISALSGGERRRLYLLRTLMTAPNVLLLDEPTNDLDIQTLSILEDYLESYSGVLIVSSHDRYFLDRTVTSILAFEGKGKITQYPGNYAAYQHQKETQIQQAKSLPGSQTQKQAARNKQKRSTQTKKLSYKQKQELDNLEAQIPELELQIETLTSEINQAGGNYQLLQKLSASLAELEAELEAAFERWATLSEIA